MSKPTLIHCKDCLYFKREYDGERERWSNYGECYANPPVKMDTSTLGWRHPEVRETSWCSIPNAELSRGKSLEEIPDIVAEAIRYTDEYKKKNK